MKKKKIAGLCMVLTLLLTGSFPFTSYAAGETVTTDMQKEQETELQEAEVEEWREQIEKVASEYIGKTVEGAVVGIADKEQILFLEGYGYGDVEKSKPIDPMTSVFEWGSITKTFTWTAVMQLVEEGKIDLSADIREYLPENYLNLTYNTPITMENLMNHTAGFEDCALELFGLEAEAPVDLEVYLKENQSKQIYQPGSVIAYSNYSASLAGFIIERVSGEKWYDYIEKHIFIPLDMKNSSAIANLEKRPDLREEKVQAIVKIPGQNIRMNWMESINLFPAGCINGTGEDLLKYGSALLNKESGLFDKEQTYEELCSYTMEAGEYITGNAHGFWELPMEEFVISHGGGTMGFSTELAVAPEEGLTVMVLTNSPLGTEFCAKVMEEVFSFREFPKVSEEMTAATDGEAEAVVPVEGNYMEARRSDTNFTKFVSALLQIKVKDRGNGELVVSELGAESVYEKVALNTYQVRESNSPMLALFFPIIEFVQNEDGKIIMRSGYIQDYVETPIQYSPFVVYLTLAIFVLSNLFFPIAALVVGIRKVVGKIRRKLFGKGNNRGSGYVLLCGSVTVCNTVIMAIRNYTSFMTFERAGMRLHMGINAAVIPVGILLSVAVLNNIRRSGEWKNNVFAVFVSVLYMVLSVFLLFWRFVI